MNKWVKLIGTTVVVVSLGACSSTGMLNNTMNHAKNADTWIMGAAAFEVWKAKQAPAWNIEGKNIESTEDGEIIEITAKESMWAMTHTSAGLWHVKEGGKKWCEGSQKKMKLVEYEEGWAPMIVGGRFYAKGKVLCSLKEETIKVKSPSVKQLSGEEEKSTAPVVQEIEG